LIIPSHIYFTMQELLQQKTKVEIIQPAPAQASAASTSDENSAKTMLIQSYYTSALYPVVSVWKMFSELGGHSVASRREFAMFVPAHTGDSYALRHLAFSTPEEMAKEIAARRPTRIEVGGVYLAPPINPLQSGIPLTIIIARETVFDIDINNYDAIRNCGCSGMGFCRSCWPLVNTAAYFISLRLRNLGAKTVVVFYSGNRGLHIRAIPRLGEAWQFCSPEPKQRQAIRRLVAPDIVKETRPADIVGDMQMLDPTLLDTVAQTLIEVPFLQHAPPQNCFWSWFAKRHPLAFVNSIIAAAPDDTVLHSMAVEALAHATEIADLLAGLHQMSETDTDFTIDSLSQETPGLALLKELSNYLELIARNATEKDWPSTELCITLEAAISCMWPRIDIEPSDQPGHLLRAPMGIHAETNRQGVLVESILDFYPRDHAPVLVYSESDKSPLLMPTEVATKARAAFETWVSLFSGKGETK
jgi:hypothetical protein